NYRPISLLSGVGKLLERIITMRLTQYQAGFQSWIIVITIIISIVSVIFADGSCKPGIGGAGLVIQGPSQSQWIEVKFPIQGITTMIGSEIEAIRQALKYVQQNQSDKDERVVILSDCKFAVNAIHNKSNSETYNFPVAECQQLMKELGENDVPEIYWIKGHSGNERADAVAKSARFQAEFNQPELFRRPDKTAPFLNFHGLNPFFTEEWNRHWTNEMEPHKCLKRYLRNLIEAQSFEKIILHRLEVHKRRYVCRVITGKVRLNGFLFKIKRADSSDCKWCGTFPYQGYRNAWRAAAFSIQHIDLRSLVIGDKTWEPETRTKVVKELVNAMSYFGPGTFSTCFCLHFWVEERAKINFKKKKQLSSIVQAFMPLFAFGAEERAKNSDDSKKKHKNKRKTHKILQRPKSSMQKIIKRKTIKLFQ
ncbi:ribonuclease H, partial [Reticulomyxa filosa]